MASSIVLQADLRAPADPDEVRGRLAALTDQHPHLGASPMVHTVDPVGAVRDRFAATPYRDGAALLRIAVGVREPTLVLAAHHGAVDGLGLLAVLGAALGHPARTSAAGVGDRPPATSFAGSVPRRLAEAALWPPTRLWRAPGPAGGAEPGEVLLAMRVAPERTGTAALAAAALDVTTWWNGLHRTEVARVVAAIGASRHDDRAALRPEHRAAFLRLRLPVGSGRDEVRAQLAGQAPEPDLPVGESRLARLACQLLTDRLGATFLVSNVGIVDVGGAVRSLAFYPQVSGPAGIAFGAVTTATSTVLTVRARRRDFAPEAAALLLGRLATALSHA
ncbi:hypothetical protein WEI85_43575 [Actinomycetes bacterium KLBMP 9797]